MPLRSNVITAVFLIVFGLIVALGWLDWLVKLAGIIMIAWGIVLALMSIGAGRGSQRW